MTTNETIVVGVDGSECSVAALRLAIGESSQRGAMLRVVTGCDRL